MLGTTRKCKRYQTIKVQRKTAEFQTRIKAFTGWTAQIIQHEIDHCNGVFYMTDDMSPSSYVRWNENDNA